MSAYHVIAVPETLAQEVRETLKAPRYGHPAHVERATGYGPCRLCLRCFSPLAIVHESGGAVTHLPRCAPRTETAGT
jgi:hypothetical protein